MGIFEYKCDALDNRDGIHLEHKGYPREGIPEYHNFMMIAYVAHGEGFHRCGDDKIKITEGDVFIINSNVIHCFSSSERLQFMEMYHCCFRPEIIEMFLMNMRDDFPELESFFNNSEPYLFIKDNSSKEIRSLFVSAIDEYMHCPPGNRYMIKSYLYILLTKLMRRYSQSINNPVFNQNKTVDEIIRYINYNLNFGIKVRDIAEAMHLSEEYLCRLFKKHTGMTLTQFMNKLKIEKAKDLLKNTDRSIESISFAINCNQTYLKRLFKKYTGMTLSDYRKKYHYKS